MFLMCQSMLLAKHAVLFILPLLLCCGVGNVHSSTVHDNKDDLRSLLDFKQGITSDPNGALTNNWTTSSHFCRWKGVTCSSTRPYRVTGLVLIEQNLGGEISSSLGNLTFLEYLILSNNSFHGVIPDELTNCSNLAYLDLSGNNLNGVIPPRIGFLTKLQQLNFHSNSISGIIPSSLGNITNLSMIVLSENQLNGPIPSEFWKMPRIEYLHLGENNLSGGIPQTLSNLSSLQELSLTGNKLGNTLPSNFGDALHSLQLLLLAENMFEGPIPASLGNASGLIHFDMSSNNFTGQIPSTFGKLTELNILNLEQNTLEASYTAGWEFFDALTNCTSLQVLSLGSNHLQGVIPNTIGNLSTNLTQLLMNENRLAGIVPSSIGKLSALFRLSLGTNNLTGTIDWIGKLQNLTKLELGKNNFVGEISPSISNLTQLTIMSLAENTFTGFIPPGLGNLTRMTSLDLSYNNFQGSIPVKFGNLQQLISIYISSNKLSGEIPETLGQCQQLTTIQMGHNLLTGNITTTFSNLNSLSMLNLSHNNLSGPLPASLNDLKLLSVVDLSYNNFEGEVPRTGIFDNASVVSLEGNPRLCGGAIDLHIPSCHHIVSKRARIVNYLVKILIPIFGFMSLLLLVYFLLLPKKTSRRSHLSQLSFGEHFEKVTYNDLAQATRDFSESNLIGRGSYGSVYSGKLKETKMEVAVKVFDLEMRGAERSFLAECQALRSIQHRNLLPIITACSTVDNTGNVFKALVYELMPNGNLDTWIHHRGDEEAPKRLSLIKRIGIVVNLADALDYLHHDCGRPTVHCDLKPSNILLDDDMNALLGDFGIARLYVDPQSTSAGSISSIGLKGTIGYIPPEYGGGGHTSTSGDVYSFGVVLLEFLTGKRPTDPMFMDGLDIISFVENSFPDQIFQVIDAYLVEECKNLTQDKKVAENEIYQCLAAMLQLALSCTRSLPSERSNMKQVASKMQAIKTSHLVWKCQ